MSFRLSSIIALLFCILGTILAENVVYAQHQLPATNSSESGLGGRPVITERGILTAENDDRRIDTLEQDPPFEGYDPMRSQWQWDRAAIVGGVLGATVVGLHIYQRNAWWQDQRTDFHFQDDPDYALNVDKAGHFFGGAFGSFLGQKSLIWSGASRETAVWGGFALGALFELYVEFEDGFARDWGFSPGDAYADVAGAAWPVVQYYVPAASHIHPKFSYFPSQAYIDGVHNGNAIDDYEGQTYWLGVHVHGLLPRSWQDYWPDWLGIALGISVRNMPHWDQNSEVRTERNLILALDYDMTKIIPGDSWLLCTLKEALNYIHFPSPAIRIAPNYVAYGLYF